MREKVAQYLTYNPRNKLIFAPSLDRHLQSVDVGVELSKAIEPDLSSKHLPMIAEDWLNNILHHAIRKDEILSLFDRLITPEELIQKFNHLVNAKLAGIDRSNARIKLD